MNGVYPEMFLLLPTSGGITVLAPFIGTFETIDGRSLNGIWDVMGLKLLCQSCYTILYSSITSAGTSKTVEPIYEPSMLTDPVFTTLQLSHSFHAN